MCLLNTCIDILQSIVEWVYQCPHQRVLWLHGLAGSGKSTLLTTTVLFFQQQRQLGAFFFLIKMLTRDVSHQTLAYQLGLYDSRIAEAVAYVINTTHRITESSLHLQFLKLIVEPLKNIPITEIPTIVIILDAFIDSETVKLNQPKKKTTTTTIRTQEINV